MISVEKDVLKSTGAMGSLWGLKNEVCKVADEIKPGLVAINWSTASWPFGQLGQCCPENSSRPEEYAGCIYFLAIPWQIHWVRQ